MNELSTASLIEEFDDDGFEESSIQRVSSLLCLSGLIVGAIALVMVRWDSLPRQIFLIGLLVVFSVLLWRMPKEDKDGPRRMRFYLAAQSVIAFLAFVQDPVFIFLFCILSGQAMMIASARSSLIWIGVFAAVVLIGTLARYSQGLPLISFRTLLSGTGFIFFGIFTSMIVQVRQAKVRYAHLLTELITAHRRLERYAEQAESLAASEERSRLARDLHDTLGHRLTVSIVQLESAARLKERDPQQMDSMIETARAQLTEGLNELRHTLNALHPPRISSTNLISSLQQTAGAFAAATGVALHTQLPDRLPPLSDAQCMTVYRTVQEALTNTQKHAQAGNVWLALEITADRLTLTARNDGRDFIASNGRGYGLRGIEERAVHLEGSLQVTRPEEGGTLLTLRLPQGQAQGQAAYAGEDLIAAPLPLSGPGFTKLRDSQGSRH
ncbi:MAG: sensor histidine kinase [Caldilineaceae bacterium]|nr:sensor histidine kinase [Caldilineaceae bacterium]